MKTTKEKISLYSIIKRLMARIKEKDRSIFYYFILYTITGGIFPILAVAIPKIVIDNLENGTFENVQSALIIFVIASCVLGFLAKLTEQIGYVKLMTLRIDYCAVLSTKVVSLDYRYTEESDFQDKLGMVWRACENNNSGIEGIYHRLYTIPAFVLSIAFYIYIIASLNILLFFVLILSVSVSLFVANYVKKLQYKHKDEISHASRRMNYYQNVSQDFAYGKDIRLYNLKDIILSKYDGQVLNYISIFRKIYNKEYKVGFFELLAILIQEGIIYGFLVYEVFNDRIGIGDFSMILASVVALSTALRVIVNDIVTIYADSLYVSDYFIFMAKNFNMDEKGLNAIYHDTLEIACNHVSFKYPKTKNYIFRDLNFTIHKGEKVAIVGVNGAGKTTLVKLITRLFDTEEGDILVNGRNVKDFRLNEFYKMFSIVFQEVNILAYSIRQNIALSDDPSHDDKVWECLKRVGLYEKVKGLPKGLDQPLLKVIEDDGIEFSGGENQKLVIARALFKDAPMVILDEPTAALDALAEAEIYQNFNDLIQDKTAIYISHRLSSTKFCDRILLFGNETLLESGTHDELMALKGEYYNMFVTQGKYYQEEQQGGTVYA